MSSIKERAKGILQLAESIILVAIGILLLAAVIYLRNANATISETASEPKITEKTSEDSDINPLDVIILEQYFKK